MYLLICLLFKLLHVRGMRFLYWKLVITFFGNFMKSCINDIQLNVIIIHMSKYNILKTVLETLFVSFFCRTFSTFYG